MECYLLCDKGTVVFHFIKKLDIYIGLFKCFLATIPYQWMDKELTL